MNAWWLNMIGFQLCWVAFVGGAGAGHWWLGLPVLAAFALWQLPRSSWKRADLLLMVIAALLGFALDSALLRAGLLAYAAPVPWDDFAPLWMTGLWLAFALTLNHSLAYLKRHLLAAVALGAIGGPLAYWFAAYTWHAVTLYDARSAMIVLSVGWAVLTPLLVRLATLLALRDVAPRAV